MNKELLLSVSENYEFYYYKNSLAEKDINKIISIQEDCYKKICSTLRICPSLKIKYYLTNTPEEVGEIYGDREPCNGFASPPDKVYAVYNDKTKCIGPHEDAHLLSYTINKPQSAFIREGLAMYFDRVWWKIENKKWVKSFIESNEYIPCSQLLNNEVFFKYPDRITYPIAGAFTNFIIVEFGVETYLNLYRHRLNYSEQLIEDVIGISLDKLEGNFINKIKG
jgi:hypothetical protein